MTWFSKVHRLVVGGSLFVLFLALSLLFGPSARSSEHAQRDVAPPLFADAAYDPPPGDILAPPGEEIVVRERYVNINPTALAGEAFSLNLFEDTVVTALQRSRQTSDDELFWLGSADGANISSVSITLVDGQARGGMAIDGRYFTLIPIEGSIHQVREILQSPEADDAGGVIEDVVEEPVEAQSIQSQRSMLAAGEPLIDVVVLWTPLARTNLMASNKQYTDMEEWINYAVQIANEGYNQSSDSTAVVEQRLRLVHAQEVPYTADGINNGFSNPYLSDLNSGSDSGTGPLSLAQSLEQTYKADLIVLIVDDTSTGAGIGYLPNSQASFTTGPNESVTRWDAIFPNLTFSHELGHNMGLHHDRANASGILYRPYAYGYRSPTDAFRTVMAYNCPTGCPRVNFFSNPNLLYSGEAMGVALNDPAEAYSAQALIDSAALVSDNRIAIYDIAIGDTFLDSLGSPDVFGEWGDSNANDGCVNDQDGANDVAGVDDATRHCVASNQVDQLYFLQAIDEVNISVGAPMTVCTLVDTEPDLFINFAICTTVVNGPGTPNSAADTVKLFSCDNSSTVTCSGATYVKDYSAARPASGGYYSDGIYYFGHDEAGPFGSNDSQLEIQVPFGDLGMSSSSNLICTKLSTFDAITSLDVAPLDQVLATNQYLQYNVDTGSHAVTVDGCGGLLLEKGALLSPFGSNTSASPSFSWNVATGATDYTLVVYDETAGTIVFTGSYSSAICTAEVCTVQPGSSLGSGNYKWLVLPEDHGVRGTWIVYGGP